MIEEAVRLIENSAGLQTIAEAENAMEKLRDLQCIIAETVTMRIPSGRLSKVEGKWYLCPCIDSVCEPGEAEWSRKYAEILAAAPLESLEGYTAQLLEAVRKEERHLFILAADQEDIFSNQHAEDLVPVTARRETLEAALAEIRRAIAVYGMEACAGSAGLDTAVIESLAVFAQD